MRRDKAIALPTMTVCLVVVVVAGILCWDWFREEYYAFKLRNGNETQKLLAAMRLSDLRSARTLPSLLMALKISISEHAMEGKPAQLWGAQLESTLEEGVAVMGEKAMPALIQGMFDEVPGYARRCHQIARRIYHVDFSEMKEKLVKELTLSWEEESLGRFLQRIENVSGVQFELLGVDSSMPVSRNMRDYDDDDIYDGLNTLTNELGLCWAIKKDTIVIGPCPKAFLNVLEEDDKWGNVVRSAAAERQSRFR
jgi:hypothetical protein